MANKVPGNISDGKNQAANNDNCGSIICDPCYQDGDKKTAEGFCVECQHYLCEHCFKYHRLPKPMRHHKLLGKSEMPRKKVDERLSEICSLHEGEMIKYYCKTHEIVGCNSCIIINHKRCDEICTLVDIAKDVEQSNLYKSFCARIEETMTGLGDQINTCKENIAITKSCRETAISDINELQEKMKKQFENLKQNIAKEAGEKEENDIRKIQRIEDSANNTKDAVQGLKEDFKILKETKQSKQLFVALNKSREKMNALEQKLKDLKKENKVEKYSFVPNKFLTSMLNSIDETGKLCTQTELVKKMPKKENSLPQGKLVVLDTTFNRLLLFDIQTQTFLSVAELGSCPSDVAVIDQNNFAITLPEEKKIKIMTIGDEGITEIGNIKVDKKGEGLYFAEKMLFITCSQHEKVLIVDVTGTKFSKLSIKNEVNVMLPKESVFGKSRKNSVKYWDQSYSFKACDVPPYKACYVPQCS